MAPQHRGTFAGLSDPGVIDYLKNLGVTAVEPLPIHAFIDERALADRGLSNYWGYNSLAFFAPHPAYLASGALEEFKTSVHLLHDAGIEVILDVVYNHTAGFLDAIGQDPVLSRVKRIAEPWDLGDGGYQLGNFPPGWGEWNDQYRDVVRRFWRGETGLVPELATRLTGSSDIFNHCGRHAWASINFDGPEPPLSRGRKNSRPRGSITH